MTENLFKIFLISLLPRLKPPTCSGYPQPPTPDSSNSRESDVFQFPGSGGGSEHQQLQHQQLQQHGGPGYLQSLLRQDVSQFPGLQDNPFLQHSREQQARFQYPPGLQQEAEKNSQETEQERPRMHNGKKVSNITENISIFSNII